MRMAHCFVLRKKTLVLEGLINMVSAVELRMERIECGKEFIRKHSNVKIGLEWLIVNLSLKLGVDRRKVIEYLGVIEAGGLIKIDKGAGFVFKEEEEREVEEDLLPDPAPRHEPEPKPEPQPEPVPEVEDELPEPVDPVFEEEPPEDDTDKAIPKNNNPFKSR